MQHNSTAKFKIRQLIRTAAMAVLVTLFMLTEGYGQNAPARSSSSVNNSFVIFAIILMTIFLLIIGLLANVLVGAAKYQAEKNKQNDSTRSDVVPKGILSLLLVLAVNTAFAQNENVVKSFASKVPGLSDTAFYFIVGVIAIQLLVIVVLLLQLRSVIKQEKTLVASTVPVFLKKVEWRKFWSRLNAFNPREREPELDLGHDYDGIRELDNRLPPWWLYGFYVTILVSAVYLWRYHVAESAPLSVAEFEISMQKAAINHEAYLKKSANLIDENTVTILSDPGALAAGKKIYELNCAACHGKAGEGTVGPNLTDEFWIHGGNIKDIFKTIKYGASEKGMKSWKDDLSPVQIAQISTFIKSIAGTNPPNAKEKQGEIYKEEQNKAGNTDSLRGLDKKIVTLK